MLTAKAEEETGRDGPFIFNLKHKWQQPLRKSWTSGSNILSETKQHAKYLSDVWKNNSADLFIDKRTFFKDFC